MMYKKIQRANEARFKWSQRGKVIQNNMFDPTPYRAHKPGRHLSKAEKKRVKKWSRGLAIMNAISEGKAVIRRNKKLKFSDEDGSIITLEGGEE